MDLKSAHLFLKKTDYIEGWLSVHDVVVFATLLEMQDFFKIEGNLLEIGVYQGKSAVLIGKFLKSNEKFEICDIFGASTDGENSNEIFSSYNNLSRILFEKNCTLELGYIPKIHECKSLELRDNLISGIYRFIHIDGSHLYSHVKHDIELAVGIVTDSDGIIVIDDFRSQHTLGVTKAIWQFVESRALSPILVTPTKMYLVKKSNRISLADISANLLSYGIDTTLEDIDGISFLRTLNLKDQELYLTNNWARSLVPPLVLNYLRRTIYFRKFLIFVRNLFKSLPKPSKKPV